MKTEAYGLYHATNSGDCSWFEFATEILRRAQLKTVVKPITTADYGARARRPSYSVLNCAKLERVLGWKMPSWREALANYLIDREQSKRH